MKQIAAVAFFILFLLLFYSFDSRTAETDKYLVFKDEKQGKEILAVRVSAGEVFDIGYTNSIYKTKQWEFYSIVEQGLVLKKIEFESGDAADYYERHIDQASKIHGLEKGNWLLMKNEPIDQVSFRVPYLHPMIVEINEETFDLTQISTPGNKITLQLRID